MELSQDELRSLERRAAAARAQSEHLGEQVARESERSRELAEQMGTSRRLRWTIRYEKAFARNAKALEDLGVR